LPTPYIIRFISTRSGVGKTRIACFLVKELKARGYRVGVIKHAVSPVNLEEKDSKRYIESGSDVVVVSSSGLAVVYIRSHRDILEDAITYAKTPIIIVEGFRESRLGDVVIIASSSGELKTMLDSTRVKPLAVVNTSNASITSSIDLKIFNENELSGLIELVETRILEHYLEQTPRTNCGMCGYSKCKELIEAYIRGGNLWCPVISRGIKLVVDDVEIPLNPFVKSIINSTLQGLVSTLRGVTPTWSKITITISKD
jgi:molybdopterin-guanine dinucleotide biosynthesis protein B